MLVINALPKSLSILTWLSLCLSTITLAFSTVFVGKYSFFIAPAVSFLTLVYLLVILIRERQRTTRRHDSNDVPFSSPLPAYSTLPSVTVAYFLGGLWVAASALSMVSLTLTEWSEFTPAVPILVGIDCYAATTEAVVWFAFACVIHRERIITLKQAAPVRLNSLE